MGQITIQGLRIFGHHGVLDQERRVGNEFEITIRLDVPASDRAMATDALADTVNYADIIALVKVEMSKPSKLIEHVAGRIRRSICDKYGLLISGGAITVAKLAPPIAAELSAVAYTTSW